MGDFYWIAAGKTPLAAATYWRMLDAYNRETLSLSERRGVDRLDLAKQIPQGPEYFYDAAHFTEAGAELVARQIAAFLLRVLTLTGRHPREDFRSALQVGTLPFRRIGVKASRQAVTQEPKESQQTPRKGLPPDGGFN